MENSFNMDELFKQASRIETEVSFEETKRAFMKSLILSAGGVLATKGVLKLLSTKKWLIMISAITTISTASVVAVMSFSATDNGTEAMTPVIESNQTIMLEDKNEVQADLDKEFSVSNENLILLPFADEKEDEYISIVSENFDSTEDFVIYEEEFDDTTNIEFDEYGNIKKTNIKPYSERFVINSKTTEAELEKMQEKAKQSGIDFNYNAKFKKSQLQKISISAKIKTNNNQQSMSISCDEFKESDDPMIFGWWANDKGKATDMGYGDENNIKCNTGPIDKHLHNHDNGMNNFDFTFDFDEDLEELASLDFETTFEFESILDGFEFEFEKMGEDLEKSIENLELNEINDLLNNFKIESESLLNDLEIQLEELKIEGLDFKLELAKEIEKLIEEKKENK